jgi:hypothetical protein
MAGGAAPGFYVEAVMLLGGAVVAAPLFKRIGLGTVLGYLAAGLVIGPVGRMITEGEEILRVAELGVVFLLFIIGLELKPARLWTLRSDIFGLGLAQVVITGMVLSALAHTIRRLRFQRAASDRLRPGSVIDGLCAAGAGGTRRDQPPARAQVLRDPAFPGHGHRAAAGAAALPRAFRRRRRRQPWRFLDRDRGGGGSSSSPGASCSIRCSR